MKVEKVGRMALRADESVAPRLCHWDACAVICHVLVLAERMRAWLLVPFCENSVRRQRYATE